MVARICWPGSTPKLVSTLADPQRIVTADKVHVYGVHNIVTSEVKDEHVVRQGRACGTPTVFRVQGCGADG